MLVVNTCGFIDSARQESVDTILEMAQLKQTGNLKRLVVAGCLVERYRDELQREIPEIDALIGVNQLKEIESVVEPNGGAGFRCTATARGAGALSLRRNNSPLARDRAVHVLREDRRGLRSHCAFCIIPKLRGVFRSRSPDRSFAKSRCLSRKGSRGRAHLADTTTYGSDLL